MRCGCSRRQVFKRCKFDTVHARAILLRLASGLAEVCCLTCDFVSPRAATQPMWHDEQGLLTQAYIQSKPPNVRRLLGARGWKPK
eukprot:SAG31_NODE_18846_length_620_cov_1.433781_1_plen_84_part_01